MDKAEQNMKRWYFQARMTALSMILAVLIYGGLGYYLVGIGKISPVRPDEKIFLLLKYGGFVLSIILFLAVRKLAGRILGSAAAQPGPRIPQKLFVASILTNAAAEFAAVLGLVLIFLSGEFMDFLPFAGLSAAGFIISFPREYQWETG